MAKKVKESLHTIELVDAFAEIARSKDINKDALQSIVEDVFRTMIRKKYGADDSFEVIFNPDSGDIQIIHVREVVSDWDLEDPVTQIELTDAQAIDEDFELEDEVATEVSINDFTRRAVISGMQTFKQRIRDLEKENISNEYQELIGEIIVGEVYQIRRNEVLVMHNKVELLLPKREQIHKDHYRKGEMIRAVVKEVRRDAGGTPTIVLSRTEPVFMERLFEQEVPEIYDGIVEIKKIVRQPGDRAKVAVYSTDDRVDPVGACVGMKGVRIHAVVRELSNENIDVVYWTEEEEEFIKRSLAPAKPISVQINDDLTPPRAKVIVRPEEVSQAIGYRGQNIKLATELTGYEIDVYRNIDSEEEDVDIAEFADELDESVIQALQNVGCDTARAVLELSPEELMRRTGLELEVSRHVLSIVRAEFEEAEDENDEDV